MVVVHVHSDEILAALTGLKDNYREAVETGFAAAGRAIVGLFRDSWLSGRTAGDLGLNIRTGNLWQSIRSLTEIRGSSVTSVVYNRGAKYWEYHQTGTDHLPKRLYLSERFEEDGAKLYASEVELAFARLA